ncbi:DUF1493 family protein [Fibrobacterales bacterium]|nr:DUF1493 family protein [Fibrobacterales bacterium]
MDNELTYINLVSFIRHNERISKKVKITEDTLLEKDLGITGDDGSELLQAIEKQFSFSFSDESGSIDKIFNLGKNEYLFHSEGFNPFNLLFKLIDRKKENVNRLSIKKLYQASICAKQKNTNR